MTVSNADLARPHIKYMGYKIYGDVRSVFLFGRTPIGKISVRGKTIGRMGHLGHIETLLSLLLNR